MDKNILEVLLDENDKSPIALLDEKGKIITFEQIAVIPMEDGLYCLLKPLGYMEGVADDEAIPFYVDETKDPPVLRIEMDKKKAMAVYDEYCKLLDEVDENGGDNNS